MATDITRKQLRESAASGLRLMTPVIAGAVDENNHTIRIPAAPNKIPDAMTLTGGAYIMSTEDNATGNEWFRILRYANKTTLDTFELAAGPDNISEGDSLAIYQLLNPDDMNDCVNEAMGELWRTRRIPITFVENENTYPCDDLADPEGGFCTWITTRSLIERIEIKDVFGQTIDLLEWAGVKITEDNNSVTIHFTYLPGWQQSASLSAVLVVSQYYVQPDTLLTDDDDTVVCPFGFANLAVQVKILKKAFLLFGAEQMRARFGAQLSLKEAELMKLKQQLMPPMTGNGYTIEENYTPDIPHYMLNPNW